MTKKLLLAITVIAILLSGCAKKMKDDIKDLQNNFGGLEQRITTLESAVKALQQQIAAGAFITSVTPLPDNAGWKITFSGGTVSSIEILNGKNGTNGGTGSQGPTGPTGPTGPAGAAGVTPHFEVRDDGFGNLSLWYNITAGYPAAGWVSLVANIKGDKGVAPALKMVDNLDGTFTVYYNVSDPFADIPANWINTGTDLPVPDAFFLAVTDNPDGTVTFTMNDGAATEYTFPRASTAVRFEIMNVDAVNIPAGNTGQITFRVNPSNAWVSTGAGLNIAKWELDEVGTRGAAYVTPPAGFELVSILQDGAKTGQYIATIKNTGAAVANYFLTLVFEAEPDVYVSSSTFTLNSPLYNPGDIAVINALIAATGLGWNPTLPADGSWVHASWTGVTWSADAVNKRIIRLDVHTKFLTGSADVSGLTALVELRCHNNVNLNTLDVSGCTALQTLTCWNTNLNTLDVSGFTALQTLTCNNANLNSLDVSGCTALEALDCGINANLSSLNVTGCTALQTLTCNGNNLNDLDVSGFTALQTLICSGTNLNTLNVTGCTALEDLRCGSNNLNTLDVSSCTALKILWCRYNNLDATALNAIFTALPNRLALPAGDIYIRDNPGTATANKTIATVKNWTVNDTY